MALAPETRSPPGTVAAFNGVMTIDLYELKPGDTKGLEARFDVLAAAHAVDLPYDPPASRLESMAILDHP